MTAPIGIDGIEAALCNRLIKANGGSVLIQELGAARTTAFVSRPGG